MAGAAEVAGDLGRSREVAGDLGAGAAEVEVEGAAASAACAAACAADAAADAAASAATSCAKPDGGRGSCAGAGGGARLPESGPHPTAASAAPVGAPLPAVRGGGWPSSACCCLAR